MQKIWLDVSHIMGWQGILTGIERVEYNIILHYYRRSNAGFVAWDKEQKSFSEVDRKTVGAMVIDRTSERELDNDLAIQGRNRFRRSLLRLSRRRSSNVRSWSGGGDVIVLAGLWDDRNYIDGLVALSETNDVVHVVYDMIPLVQPGFVVDFLPAVFQHYMLTVLPNCKKIVAISEATKSDVIRVLKEHKLHIPQVASFRLGEEVTRASKASKPIGVPDKFILSVGTIESRKNHQLLYYAYKRAAELNTALPSLIIAGRRGWHTDDFQYVVEHDIETKDKIKIFDKVSDSEMRWLYEHCLYTVFPSFYEGWGLPVAESLGYHKVTIASRASSMPEVGADCADYISPTSVDELLETMAKYGDKRVRQDRERQIAEKHTRTTWKQSVQQFADLI